MRREQLIEAATLLAGTKTGDWLNPEIKKLRESPVAPRGLVIKGATRELADLLPDGPPPADSWTELAPDLGDEASAASVLASDVELWVMTATRMFPGQYAAALSAIRAHGVPVWALVTGLERLGDPEQFLRVSAPECRSRLPDHSKLIFAKRGGPPLRTELDALFAKQGLLLAREGEQRRLDALSRRCRTLIGSERRQLSDILARHNRFAQTAEAGERAAAVMCGPAATRIVEGFNQAVKQLAELPGTLADVIAGGASEQSSEELKADAMEQVQKFREEHFDPHLSSAQREAISAAATWLECTDMDLQRSFGGLIGIVSSSEQTKAALTLPAEKIRREVEDRANQIARSLSADFETLTAGIEGDLILQILRLLGTRIAQSESDQPESREKKPTAAGSPGSPTGPRTLTLEPARRRMEQERIVALVEQSVLRATDAMTADIKACAADVQARLRDHVEECASRALTNLGASLAELQEVLQHLAAGERSLDRT